MTAVKIFDSELALPDDALSRRERTLLGFEERYGRVRDQLRLLLLADEIGAWNKRYHGGQLAVTEILGDQYPFVIFHGDVGTGKTVSAECIANRLVAEARAGDAVLFKLSNRVRGSGKVGEMGTLLSDAFQKVVQSAGRQRRAVLVIDEGDSLAAARSQEHSHHEDKVAVNTLIQGIDDLRKQGGRVVVILCTNRASALDPALRRRAAIMEEFKRPSDEERRRLLGQDLAALELSPTQMTQLVTATGARGKSPPWTFSDIRTRLYPAAVALAFPKVALGFEHLTQAAASMEASPTVEDR